MPSNSGRLLYRNLGPRTGECFLNCHGKEHNPARYPVNTTTSSAVGTIDSSLNLLR
jgi:hypothetical protein